MTELEYCQTQLLSFVWAACHLTPLIVSNAKICKDDTAIWLATEADRALSELNMHLREKILPGKLEKQGASDE